MATKNRTQLKELFENGLTPDEDDFGDLIDAMINSVDDNIKAKNGKIGIGTSNPQANLHIYETSDKSEIGSKSGAFMIGNANASNLSMDNNEIMAQNGVNTSTLHVQRNGGDVRFYDQLNTENKVVVKDTGRIGIGTTDPGAPLHVNRSTDVEAGHKNAVMILGDKNGKNLSFDDNEIMAKITDGETPGTLHLQVNGGDLTVNNRDADKQFIFKDSGKLGIGIGDPQAYVHINVSGDKVTEPSTNGALIIGKTSGEHLAFDQNEIMAKQDSNSVGTLLLNWTSGTAGLIRYKGTLENASDLSLKKDVKPMNKGMKELSKLNPVSFKWKDASQGNKRTRYGFIAQEVAKVLKDIVTDDPEGGPMSMDTNALIPLLVNSVQEQQAEIKDLNARIAKLEKLISKK